MAPAPEQTTAPKLPTSADFNAIYNRISLASAKQSTFLSSMRAKYPSLARPSTITSSTLAPTADANGIFSFLKKPKSTLPTETPSTRVRVIADDSDLRFENPNTGVGYSAPRSEEKASAATRDLSRRLLGKRGRETEQKTVTQKPRVQEEESEEEGRSGLGRKKKRRIRTEDETASPDAEVDDAPPTSAKSREGADAQADLLESNSELPVAGREQEENIANPSVAEAEAENDRVHKKKKKKNKKKTRKANVVAPV